MLRRTNMIAMVPSDLKLPDKTDNFLYLYDDKHKRFSMKSELESTIRAIRMTTNRYDFQY